MQEIVLGLGRQKSLRSVVSMAEAQLRKTQGVPRKIVARSDTVEVTAERGDFKGDFETFSFSARVSRSVANALRTIAIEYSDACSLEEESGIHLVHCPAVGNAFSPRSFEAVDKLSGAIPLPETWRVSGDNYRIDTISSELLFQALLQYKASDVHLSPGETPVFRVDGSTLRSELIGVLSSAQIYALIRQLASDIYWREFEEYKQTSFSFHQVGLGYARVSAFMKSGAPHCTLRFLPENIPSFEDLNIPKETMVKLAQLHHGLVLITGMTGSGKTTTAAALVDWINSTATDHIITIENPIEYVHTNKKSIISQRNLGSDVNSFGEAVRGALRHDPDVIVIGEMRDPDTIRSAINAAATGHLVISTLHSNTAYEVVNRIVSFFDPIERDLVRLQLRDCTRCVICQRLVPKVGGGRIPALEIMFNDIKPINDGICEGDTDGIRIGMQQTVSHSFLFEDYLLKLYKAGKIDLEHARTYSTDESVLDQMIMGTYSVPRLDSLKELRHAGRA
ncbi:MAG TPA: PilT/PilU family type 4a pilus ATPase [Candidatus Hydrogenedentes bacterium]|nr:PilT/PilU family type 4a pilus ATPase [Candidatus Hydrogenedentota bacterium]HRT19632.1 PilT/PilU family type 4a pilus ATPase [Candidatus Hydrogenedentota bacterium]HRT64406.1 PilT/PilU family type 4a pilus ATPase [Candidatus Hydrogenedentota bacterium]